MSEQWFAQAWRDDPKRLKAVAYLGAAVAKRWGLYSPQRKNLRGALRKG